jgi:Cupin-like domain
VQGDRASDPDYENEARKSSHHRTITVGQFLDLVEYGQPNDVYLTANNFDAVDTRNIMSELADDFRPVPPYLTGIPSSAFLWLGKDTLTPVHHDTTMNLMCQIMGAISGPRPMPAMWLVALRQGVRNSLHRDVYQYRLGQ